MERQTGTRHLGTFIVVAILSGVARGQDLPVHLPAVEAPVPQFPSTGLPEACSIPWWQPAIADRLRPQASAMRVDLQGLVLATLNYSYHVRAIAETPLIRQTAIVEANADFDVKAFMDSKFVRTSEPVSDLLTTGGPPRFRQSDWGYRAGLRQRTRLGGTLELSQRIGYLDNNSLYFVPPQQGNARLAISFEQPLLNGAGRLYNCSLVMLAQLDAAMAWDRTSQQLQEHLLEVTRAYWELYLQRAVLLQLQRLHAQAEEIFTELQQRRGVDSLKSQIVLAEAAVASRKAELIRAAAAIQNAEARIRALVNAPKPDEPESPELLPGDVPWATPVPVPLRDALVTALARRPEVAEAMKKLDAGRIRLDMSKNELLPALSAVVETYVSGLQGDSLIGQAIENQFTVGEPSYSAGLLFEVPLENRAARARLERRQREVCQLTHQFHALLETLSAEVEVAVREVDTTCNEIPAKSKAMAAAQTEVEYMTERWRLMSGEDRAASFLLEDLLTAQDRLAVAEYGMAKAQASHAVALADLKRAMGLLLQCDQLTPQQLNAGNIPQDAVDVAPPVGQ
jgi:outer membrane protein